MIDIKFIGREREKDTLNDILGRKTATLMVIKGRRRIGKTRLIEEFGSDKPFLRFVGLAPEEGIDEQAQRDEFAHQLNQQTGLPEMETDDWSKLFALLAERVKTGRQIILFDEITWMAHEDPTFLSKLKNAWELHFSKNPKLILILCGSVSAWIEKNILSSAGYFGRIAKKLTLKELPLVHCNKLLELMGFKRSAYEKFLYLSLTGGIPWYIELVNANLSASDNIQSLCFDSDGILVAEHKYIFHDLFGRRSDIYEKITSFLAKNPAELTEISEGISYAKSGTLSEYLNELVEAGYIRRDHQWSFKTGENTAVSQYRLCDNYLRFYYRYIKPKLNLIEQGQFSEVDIATLPGFNTVVGLQFENLVYNNRSIIHEALNISPNMLVASNPYYQRKTKSHRGCQIDYLIQTRHNTLFVCEIKFSQKPLSTKVIDEVKEKISRLTIPKNFTCVPVLIHVNGVSDSVVDTDYFFKIIDFSEQLD